MSPKSTHGQYSPSHHLLPPGCLTRAHSRGRERYLCDKQKLQVQAIEDIGTQMPLVFPRDSGHIINLSILLNSMEEEAVFLLPQVA